MRLSLALLTGAALAACVALATPVSAAPRPFQYVSPTPGSDRVSRWNNLAIRQGADLDPASVDLRRLTVTGSASGPHSGRFVLARDGRTLIFTPDQPYATGETVHVRLAGGTRTLAGGTLPELSFDFRVSGTDPKLVPRSEPEWASPLPTDNAWWRAPAAPATSLGGPCDTILAGFPPVQLFNVQSPDTGVYFFAPFTTDTVQAAADFEIKDDLGRAIYERIWPGHTFPVDFKMQPDGRLTFWTNGHFEFMVMDSAYAIVDSFSTGNGYSPDLHDIRLLPNGHALLMSYDPETVGMDTVVTGGNPAARVIGLIVQELDQNKNVVFQWRSWDHYKITDGSVSGYVNLTGSVIDYVHGNSVEEMPDGNLLVSARHMNELTKIDRQTGDIIWRLGLNAVNNQFSFPNDTRGWSHQHDARILPNGHLTVFDNGNFLTPTYSRALEFSLDEQNKVATKVWEYRHSPDVFGGFMGDVQRHPDGSTTIGWGGTDAPPSMTDLHADGTISGELGFPLGLVNYRALRFPWRTNRILTDQQDVDVGAPAVGTSWGKTVKVWNHWNQTITINCLRTDNEQLFGATPAFGSLPITLAPGDTTLVQVVYSPVSAGTTGSRLYIVQQSSTEMVAQTVEIHGHIDGNVAVSSDNGLVLSTAVRPNPSHSAANIEFTLPSTSRVTLELYDVGGRKVATLVDGVRAAGRHIVPWSGAGEPGGLYFYRLRVNGRTMVRKLVLAR